jgi:hypothetical protein
LIVDSADGGVLAHEMTHNLGVLSHTPETAYWRNYLMYPTIEGNERYLRVSGDKGEWEN